MIIQLSHCCLQLVAVALLAITYPTKAASPASVFFIFNPADSVQLHTAGSPVRIVLAAKDTAGNVIADWNSRGTSITLILRNSMANLDSSSRSWNGDPEGFSWAQLYRDGARLTPSAVNRWVIPPSAFTDGLLELTLVHTKAEQNIHFELSPIGSSPKQMSARLNFVADEVTNYFVAITSAAPPDNAVFVLRPYELIVAPRDRWLNVSSTEILSLFSARWPGEFGGGQGTADLFAGAVFIKGSTNFPVASRNERLHPDDPQRIIVYSVQNSAVYGESSLFEVRPHAPNPFTLIGPTHRGELRLTPNRTDDFIWSRPTPPDPYTDIRISASDTTLRSDQVHYTWVIVDAQSLTHAIRLPSNNHGLDPRITLTHGHLAQIMWSISGSTQNNSHLCVWYVEADDGLYTTRSTPLPGYEVTIKLTIPLHTTGVPASTGFTLEQNFPNPFNPQTTIRFSVPQSDRVSLKILNLLGEEIRTIYDQETTPGTHEFSFNAAGLVPGVYIYALETSTMRLSRRMVVL